MYKKLLRETYVKFLLYALIIVFSMTMAMARENSSKGHRISMAERSLLRSLGLAEDANDTEIIRLLDLPVKRISAAALASYRKIYSATPKLLQIVNDDRIFFPARISAAKTLCDFGNREWMPSIKILITDPNSVIAGTSYEIEVAGLLARTGDYSHFEVAKKGINNTKSWVRHVSVKALANFRHEKDPITDSAVELLSSVATSDPVPRLRHQAIYSLDKIAAVKPEVRLKVIDASQANIGSADESLSLTAKAMLMKYGKSPKEPKDD